MKSLIIDYTTIFRRMTVQVIIALLFSASWNTSVAQECNEPNATMELSVNNFIATLLTGEDLFTTGEYPGYEIPAGSGVHPIFALDFWAGGRSPDLQLKLAGGIGKSGSETDYYTGPLDLETAEVVEDICGLYDQFTICYLHDSEIHKLYHDLLTTGGDVDAWFPDGYIMPEYFNSYPAHGNDAQAQFLAPFYDYDGDGTYDPEFGDFPLFSSMIDEVEGECVNCNALHGDVSVFWIDNDKGNVHSATNGQPIGLEIHNVFYAFYEEEGVLSNTSFLQKRIFNRGTQVLEDFGISLYADVDLGNPFDDYVGCIPSKNLGFVYNADNMDEPTSSSEGYGENPPVFGILQLAGLTDDLSEPLDMTHFMYMAGGEGGQSRPSLAAEYYNYLSGYWKDGTPLTCGQTGYGDGEDLTNYAFSHEVDGPNCYWTENEEGLVPNDKSMLISSFGTTLSPGDEHCVTYAFIYEENESSNIQETIAELENSADFLIENFNNCYDDLIATNVSEFGQELDVDFVYDGSNNQIRIRSTIEIEVTVFNSIGQQIMADKVIRDEIISVRDLAPGMYIVNFKDNQNRSKSKKIIIE